MLPEAAMSLPAGAFFSSARSSRRGRATRVWGLCREPAGTRWSTILAK